MKITTMLAALTLTVGLAGCSSGSDTAPASSPTTAPVVTIPSPAGGDQVSLLAGLRAITPPVPDYADGDKLIDHARNVCSSIQGGASAASLTSSTVARFSTDVEPISNATAARIVAVVRSTFCN